MPDTNEAKDLVVESIGDKVENVAVGDKVIIMRQAMIPVDGETLMIEAKNIVGKILPEGE
jgi:NADPH:quinone reductase-like Zn-dependent oxidoreductase